jgi:hypothetical protein
MKGLTKTARRIALLACLLFTVGCTAQTAPTATTAPTADLNVVKTEAAQTVVAQITSDAALTPSATLIPPTATALPATATPADTATPYVMPTMTVPVPTIAPTHTYITVTSAPVPFKATLISLSPATGATFNPGDSFDGVVTLRNDGTVTWTNKYHVRYVSGDEIGSTSRYYLSGNVVPGDSVKITVDDTAPSTAGNYDSVYQLFNDNEDVIYTFHIIIKVAS